MWQEPKTDWTVNDYFNYTDYNRIKNNIAYLREQALKLYINFPFTEMGVDKEGYSDFPYAEEFNAMEDNLESLNIPWHTSDETKHCKFYSNADMAKITATAMTFVTWHITYFRDLRIYIRSLESKEDVGRITYGTGIPEAYQSEPLKAMLAQKS